jgi:hypothetical protein
MISFNCTFPDIKWVAEFAPGAAVWKPTRPSAPCRWKFGRLASGTSDWTYNGAEFRRGKALGSVGKNAGPRQIG